MVQRFVLWVEIALLVFMMVQATMSDAAAGTWIHKALPSVADQSQPAISHPQIAPPHLDLIGQLGGSVIAFTVSSDFIYAAIGPRVKSIATSNPAHPTILGETDILPALPVDVEMAGHYVIVAMRDYGLLIFDVADPAVLLEVGAFSPPDLKIRALVVEDDLLYLTHDAGLTIFDINNPATPVALGSVALPAPDGGKELAVVDHIVYIAAYRGGIRIVNAQDPAAPVETGFLQTSSSFQDLAVAAPYVYAVTRNSLVIINAADIVAPVQVGKYTLADSTPFRPLSLATRDGYVYVTAEYNGFLAFNVANPTLPIKLDAVPSPYDTIDLIADDRYIYAISEYSLQIFLPPQPTHPPRFSFFPMPNAPAGLAINAPYAYVADSTGLQILDVTDPFMPVQIGQYAMTGGAKSVTLVPPLAYVIDQSRGGLHILDITSPATPAEVFYYQLPTAILDLKVIDSYLFLVDINKLRVLDTTIPKQTVELASLVLSISNRGIDILDNYAYIATINGISIVDVHAPAMPALVTTYPILAGTDDIVFTEGYAYVRSISGIHILDYTQSLVLREVGVIGVNTAYLALEGHYLYIDGWGSLDIYDISDPAAATLKVRYQPAGLQIRDLVQVGNQIFLAAHSGIFILQTTTPIVLPSSIGLLTFPFSHVTDIKVAENFLYTTDAMRLISIINITDPATPVEIGYADKPYTYWEYYENDIEIANSYAYVVYNRNLHIVNITDPAQPIETSHPVAISQFTDVAIAGNYLYATGGISDVYDGPGLWSIDIHDPEQPIMLNATYISWASGELQSRSLVISGHYAYIGGAFTHWRIGSSGVFNVVDITNPEQLAMLSASYLGAVQGLAPYNNYIFVTATSGKNYVHDRLHAMDVSNPVSPISAAAFEMTQNNQIVIAGQRAYLTSSSGLAIFTIHYPLRPILLLNDPLLGWPVRTAVNGEYVYVATVAAGLLVYRYVEPAELPHSWLPLIQRH